jgi:mono/diheme cytochrome c family protein
MTRMNDKLWTLAYCLIPIAAVVAAVVLLSGCSAGPQRSPSFRLFTDMEHQQKYQPQSESPLFADHRSNRQPPAGVVARGHLRDDDVLNTGFTPAGLYTGKNPLTITAELLKTGQTRFNTYCTPCHDRTGSGKGIVALRTPAWQPSNLLEDRVKTLADGYIFDTITNGRRSMPAYRFQIQSEHDRWAIVAYVRALQRATSGTVADVPENLRAGLK